jgi:hypothetical protein
MNQNVKNGILNKLSLTKLTALCLGAMSSLAAAENQKSIAPTFLDSRQGDSLALIGIYDSMDGSNWSKKTHWKTAEPMDNWEGVSLQGGRVSKLNLRSVGATGDFPAELGNLSELDTLYCQGNEITSLPSSINELEDLEILAISFNEFTALPDQITELQKLRRILAEGNYFETLPEQLGSIANLEMLNIQGSNLTRIPSSITSLSFLSYLGLHQNKLGFDAIEQSYGDVSRIEYYGQKALGDTTHLDISSTQNIGIIVGGSQNHYTWYKDGIAISPAVDSDTIEVSESGVYYATISSDSIPSLTLTHNPIIVNIGDIITEVSALTRFDGVLSFHKQRLELYGHGLVHVEIFNLSGKRIMGLSPTLQGQTSVTLNKSLQSGIYFLSLSDKHNKEHFKLTIP